MAALPALIYMSLSQWCIFLHFVILYFKASLNDIEATGFSCESLAPASMKTQDYKPRGTCYLIRDTGSCIVYGLLVIIIINYYFRSMKTCLYYLVSNKNLALAYDKVKPGGK